MSGCTPAHPVVIPLRSSSRAALPSRLSLFPPVLRCRSWQGANTLDDERPTQLRCILQVHNSGEGPFTFTTALQTHLAAEDIAVNAKLVKTVGLRGEGKGMVVRPRLARRVGGCEVRA